jgi:hypothetical protein
MTQVKKASRATVYKTNDHYCNQAFVIQSRSGDVLCVFNEERDLAHADNGYTSLIRSRDGGQTWDQSSYRVVLPYTEHTGNWDSAIAQLQDGSLLINLCQTAFFKRGMDWEAPQYDAGEFSTLRSWLGTYVLKSSDDGRTWGEPIPVNTTPIKMGSTRVSALQLPGGGILLPLYGRMDGTFYGMREHAGEYMRAYFVRSDDGGANWEHFSTIAYDPAHVVGYAEPAPLLLRDGRIVVLLRVHHRPTQRPDNIYMVVSDDGGYTFGPPKRLPLWGYPCQLINLQDGRVLLTYGYRRGEFGVKACVSDDGVTWDPARVFALHEGGQGPSWERTWWHTGYPSTAQLADGSLVTTYHLFSQEDRPVQYIESVSWELGD